MNVVTVLPEQSTRQHWMSLCRSRAFDFLIWLVALCYAWWQFHSIIAVAVLGACCVLRFFIVYRIHAYLWREVDKHWTWNLAANTLHCTNGWDAVHTVVLDQNHRLCVHYADIALFDKHQYCFSLYLRERYEDVGTLLFDYRITEECQALRQRWDTALSVLCERQNIRRSEY
ncbi:MAG: hypothetical protein Q4G42_09910 [Neisseria sp.]|nr:hypothetical protein [Neisseria sp.]